MFRFKTGCISLLVAFGAVMFAFVPGLHCAEAPLLSAHFKEVRETSLGVYGIFMLTNTGQHDIDDIRLSLLLKNENDEIVSSIALTDATKNYVWLEAGQSKEAWLPVDDKYATARHLLESQPDTAQVEIEIKSITFMDKSN